MTRSRTLLVPLLAGLLVAAVLGIAAGGDQVQAAAEPRTITRKIMIPAAAFIPTTDNLDYANGGNALYTATSGSYFFAPLFFPVQTVNIRMISLYALDNGSGKVCVYLRRSSPSNGSQIPMGLACTTDSPDSPQLVRTTAISPRRANTAFTSLYLDLNISPGLVLYGVAVTYTYDT